MAAEAANLLCVSSWSNKLYTTEAKRQDQSTRWLVYSPTGEREGSVKYGDVFILANGGYVGPETLFLHAHPRGYLTTTQNRELATRFSARPQEMDILRSQAEQLGRENVQDIISNHDQSDMVNAF